MIKIVKKIASEPLLHFLVAGFILYVFYSISTDEQVKSKKNIQISSQELQEMKLHSKEEFGRDLDANALEALVQRKYYEKVLLNEAYSLGLQKQDKEISQKLLKQMHHVMTNSSALTEPSEELLYQYYEKNKDDYSLVENLSFSHVFFMNKNSKSIEETLKVLQIAEVKADKASSFGDISPIANHIKSLSFKEVQEEYGKYFATKLFHLKQGLWHSPVLSKYGMHLIYVSEKNIGEAYSFDEVQGRVYKDYLDQEKRNRLKQAYAKLQTQYTFEVK